MCYCVSGFSGRHCQVTSDLCRGKPCSNGGCVNNYSKATYKCFCDYPYQLGSNGQCEMMDLCNTTNCNNGTCNPLNGKCGCADGYEGSLCQQSVDECKTSPCKNGGTCADGHKDYSCECISAFTGKDCEKNIIDCPGSCNLTNTAVTVDKIDECECICIAGYTGINCTEEIDECASFPCKHGANCTDRVSDYHCYCTEGWTGKNCDQQMDYCTTTSNKCQSGECFNLIDDKYCRCSAGTRGDTCEDIPDVCNVVNPCTTMGSCTNLNGTAECFCQINYSGNSCQLLKDFCTGSTTCLYMGMPGTGGTCTNLESGWYNCQCQTGYSGATCQTKTTLCSTLNCGSIAQCHEEIGCYCPEGKILTDNKACKQPSNDFDMLFDPQIGDEGAYTTAVLNDPDNSDLSFMLWVRFNKDQKDIENTVILKLGDFAEVKNDSITVWNTTNNFVVDFTIFGKPIEMDNGKWHVIVCSWKRNGESLVVVDGVKVFENMFLPGILPKVFKVEIGKKFEGRISQVKIWANSLTISDVYHIDENKDYNPPGSTVVHGWYNYRMNKGVVKKSPTQIENEEVCDVPACSSSDKIKPKIKDCADDVSKHSADRIFSYSLSKFIDIFEDFNESLSLSSHSGGNTFTWGDYSLLFMASDDNGNTAMCHSKLYVRYNHECPAPRTSSQKIYCSASSKDICKLECPSNQELSLPAPKYIPCSELGVYNPLKPQEKVVLPSCGDTMSTTIQIDVLMVYSLQVTCSETYETAIETKLMADFMNKINQTWNALCSSNDCSGVSIKPSCVPDSKQMMVAIQMKSLSNEITRISDGSEKYTPKEVLRMLIFEEDAFDAKEIGGAKVLNDQVVITDTFSCPAGYTVIGDNCVACSMGTFYDSSSQNCEFCPVGSYGSSTGLIECFGCGSGKITFGVGYTSNTDCVGDCPVGEFWDGSRCSFCSNHYYQNMTGKDYCFPCPLGKKTSGKGSISPSQCFDDCPEGTQLKPDGNCVDCPRGYYRSFLLDVCMECPAGNTTAGNGSTSKDSCYITMCYNGTFRNKTTNVCEPCPVGEYQPKDLQEECIKCPENYSTEAAGKNNRTDCKSVENGTSYVEQGTFFLYYYIGVGIAIFVLLIAISVIIGRVFCRQRATKPKRHYYENPLTTRTSPEDSYTGLSNSGEYTTIDEMREYMNMQDLGGSTDPSDIYLTPRGHRN
ncbi:uncharacterized protein [Magallana gigas]|uniref:uncharacterized protein n=1 Tax=Magallana gigas TaxID=29159 RepID=UPI00333EB028